MRKLDLRTGRPVWLSYRSEVPKTEKISRDLRTDVAIVGMGISGAMVADLLTEAGMSVVMIDRRGIAKGSTPATTALIQFEIDTPLNALIRSIGRDKAVQAWRRARLAVGNLRDRIGELDLNCTLVPRPTLYLAGNVLSGTPLREEAEARRAAGLPARYLTAGQLRQQFGIERDGAILSHGNLALDPVKLTRELLDASQKRGARLFAPEEAVKIEHNAADARIHLKSGRSIIADHVILSTGYELIDPVKDKRHEIISTWAIATKRQDPSNLVPQQPLIWEASDPYLYLRTTHDGRIICGGEDASIEDEAERDALIEMKTERLVKKLGKLLPSIDPTPDFIWAGSFGNTSTGLPLIGPVPGKPRITALMGYGGNGITFSRIAAELILTNLTGQTDSDAAIFAL